MRIIKRHFNCLFGPDWQKEYQIDKSDLEYYLKLNTIKQPTSYMKYSGIEELVKLNPEDEEYINSFIGKDLILDIPLKEALDKLNEDYNS